MEAAMLIAQSYDLDYRLIHQAVLLLHLKVYKEHLTDLVSFVWFRSWKGASSS